jgi:hypothetical protein
MPKSLRDVLAGVIFVAFGVAFAFTAWSYDLGTMLRMGPGYFPLLLGIALAALGLAIVVEGLTKADAAEIGQIPWRGIVLISAAVLFFGFSVRRLGLAPALFVAVFLAALSSQRMRLIEAVALAVGMTLFCVLIFVWGLGMPVPLLGPWLSF